MTYTVQDTTMTALGDAIRKQTEFYIETTERPIEPDFVLRGNTADFETYDMYYYGIAYHFIKLDLEELLGNKFPYTKYFYILQHISYLSIFLFVTAAPSCRHQLFHVLHTVVNC